ncbi:major facilitator superfamily domain-containing protein [Aspergillus leporis]|uniref:Major facilitator superfamily domain-containing protein n=1 Tax=Aspergillus leporis TaxID=41062 RepID=A0A5N5WZD9_9EURO|nr:major facilitator superfamily domain-containing protein [Aspergillus leporis]
MAGEVQRPWGYRWRSSRTFIISTIIIALFSETFLYAFVVPIMSYMLEVRLRQDPSKTQRLTTAVLTVHGFVSLVSAPIIAHFADKTPGRKTPLLISLAGCLAGTLLVASTISIEALFIGRVLQAVAGSAAWIVGFATLTDNVGMENMGKVMGWAFAFVTAGMISGPFVGGALLELVGYWPTWSVPSVILFLDILARRLMIEKRDLPPNDPTSTSPSPADAAVAAAPEDSERSALLPSSSLKQYSEPNATNTETQELKSPSTFYRTMLSDVRVIASVANSLIFSILIAAFDATLPLHLRNVFHWNTLSVGMSFLAIQVPTICLSPGIGWLRDRVGIRYSNSLGWVLIAPLLWLLGVPGQSSFPWASAETNGQAIFITALIGIGIVMTLVRGAGTIQLVAVIKDMESKNPKVFGEHGGSSRVFSMVEVAFSLGCMLGPLLSGSLSEAIGYYYMNVTLAAICLLVALSSFSFFRL